MATVGGNLLQRTRCAYFYDAEGSRCNKREPGTGCDARDGFHRNHAVLGASESCIATHPSDMGVALAALDATVHLSGPGGDRVVAVTDLHRLPGDRPDVDTVLRPAELITAVELPALPIAATSAYRKVRDRASYAFALVSVAAALRVQDGRVAGVRLALGGVAHKPWRARRAEELLRGGPATTAAFSDALRTELAPAVPLRDRAAELVTPSYAAEPAVTTWSAAKARGTARASNYGMPLTTVSGDADAALSAAAVSVDHTYTTPRESQNAMEPHAATVVWDGDTLVVHDCTQLVSQVAVSLAEVFGLRPDQVRVSAPFVGGGFGGKGLWSYLILAAAVARMTRRPVRAALSREGVYRLVGGRTLTEQRVAIGARADGRFDAIIHTGLMAMTEHNAVPEAVTSATGALYAAGSFRLEVDRALMDTVANFYMRAPGEAPGSFALESAIDELAHELGIDPVELRLRNEPETEPVTGRPFSSRHAVEAYRAGAERFGWSARSAVPGPAARESGGSAPVRPPRPTRTCASPAAPPASCCSREAASAWRPRRTRWAWARPRSWPRAPRNGSRCR
ncbi:hypothetical protein Asp14428_20270 [Actinoplanes sp. NBRC 14428]|nr:hypothetical protein Asp14428_20270 [Actinoplanes sp. NBRC 14428]